MTCCNPNTDANKLWQIHRKSVMEEQLITPVGLIIPEYIGINKLKIDGGLSRLISGSHITTVYLRSYIDKYLRLCRVDGLAPIDQPIM